MSREQLGEPEHEGEHYLRLIGLGDLAEQEIVTGSGNILGRDFLQICGEGARPALVAFENMNPEDPKYGAMRDVLQGVVMRYVQGGQPG